MEDNRVSITALITAYVRGYHATHDDPKIFDDFLAPRLFTEQESRYLGHNLALSLAFLDPELAALCPDEASALAAVMRIQSAATTLSRSHYTESNLDRAVKDGVKQYVILGAGLDTFAFRKPEMLTTVQVFEVDHPATQADKRRRLAEVGWNLPATLHWVPVDFATQDLEAALKNSPYDPRQKTFFSWLGVTYYLTRVQVLGTLRGMASLAPSGSLIVFDYMEADAFVPERAGKNTRRLLEIVRTAGEPMKSGFDPTTLATDLVDLGLELVQDLGPAEIQQRYFKGRTDGYHALEHVHIARAMIV